mmetsp:Transcript_55935/g.173428  ORF Transcript_55935/g.173428 Transcript_55935/m.173428 type:complete len:309 (-) Transcript_55935:106-1032(-)
MPTAGGGRRTGRGLRGRERGRRGARQLFRQLRGRRWHGRDRGRLGASRGGRQGGRRAGAARLLGEAVVRRVWAGGGRRRLRPLPARREGLQVHLRQMLAIVGRRVEATNHDGLRSELPSGPHVPRARRHRGAADRLPRPRRALLRRRGRVGAAARRGRTGGQRVGRQPRGRPRGVGRRRGRERRGRGSRGSGRVALACQQFGVCPSTASSAARRATSGRCGRRRGSRVHGVQFGQAGGRVGLPVRWRPWQRRQPGRRPLGRLRRELRLRLLAWRGPRWPLRPHRPRRVRGCGRVRRRPQRRLRRRLRR